MEVLKCSGEDRVLRPGGGAGSGPFYYLGSRGAICLCGLTCFLGLGDPGTLGALGRVYLSCRPTDRGRVWREDGGGAVRVLDDFPERCVMLDAHKITSLPSRLRHPDEPKTTTPVITLFTEVKGQRWGVIFSGQSLRGYVKTCWLGQKTT